MDNKELLEITEQIDEYYEVCDDSHTRGKLFAWSQKIKDILLMDNNKAIEARRHIEIAKDNIGNLEGNITIMNSINLSLERAIALLRCPTCGGKGTINTTPRSRRRRGATSCILDNEIPCPDCQSQEPAKSVSEFIERVSDNILHTDSEVHRTAAGKVPWETVREDMIALIKYLEAETKRADEAEKVIELHKEASQEAL